jgi:hypothetical protein
MQKQFLVVAAQPCVRRYVRTQSWMHSGMLAGSTCGTLPLQAPANQSSRSGQQLSWSEGPSGEQDSGVGAWLQRQEVVNSGSIQPSRAGESWSEVMQFV